MPESENIFTQEQIEQLLRQHQIPVDTWGRGEAKTLAQFVDELNAGESSLATSPDSILRILRLVGVDVVHTEVNGQSWILQEDRQVFRDGRVRRRPQLTTSLSEKLKPREIPLQAASRALQEELGIVGEVSLTEKDILRTQTLSQSFPGLQSVYENNVFQANLTAEQYNPSGYTERQPDKTTYFVWLKQ